MIPIEFDTSLKGTFDETTTGTIRTIVQCVDSNLNIEGHTYSLEVKKTVKPIDLSNMKIRIRGRIALSSNTDEKLFLNQTKATNDNYLKVYSSWIYNAFQRITLSFGSTLIESIDNPALQTEMLKNFLPYTALEQGTYENTCGVFEFPINSVDQQVIPGTYSKTNRTHLLNPDGTFQLYIPASFLFQTLKTLPTIYKNIFPIIRFIRNSTRCVGVTFSKYEDDLYDAVTNDNGALEMILTSLQLEYDEYDQPPLLEELVAKQYWGTTLMIPHRKISSQIVAYKGRVFSSDIAIPPSMHGNVLLVMQQVCAYVPQSIRSRNHAGYMPERLSLDSIKVGYGRHVAMNINDMSRVQSKAADAKDRIMDYGKAAPAEEHYNSYSEYIGQLYESYVDSCKYMYSHEDLCLSKEQWMKHQIICVPLSQFIFNTEELSRQISISLSHNDEIDQNTVRYMHVWLVSHNVITYDPTSYAVEATGV